MHDKLTAKQNRAIAALLTEPKREDAARLAGVNLSTIWRWFQDQAFVDAYQAARYDLLESVLTSLQAASVGAVGVLRKIMEDTEAGASARVSAARIVLDLSLKAREILSTEERLLALEARFAKANEGNNK